jgi:hypothetical protein
LFLAPRGVRANVMTRRVVAEASLPVDEVFIARGATE